MTKTEKLLSIEGDLFTLKNKLDQELISYTDYTFHRKQLIEEYKYTKKQDD